MTLLNLCRLARHYWKMVVAVVLICTLAGSCLGVLKAGSGGKEYSAEAVLTISEPTATISASELIPLIEAISANVTASNVNDVTVNQESDVATRTITFTAVASTEEESIEAANAAAHLTIEEAKAQLSQIAQQYREVVEVNETRNDQDASAFVLGEKSLAAAYETVSFTLNDASQAISNSGRSTIVKFFAVGLLGGVFLALCLIVVLDVVRAPVKSRDDLKSISQLPILASNLDDDSGRRLWTNVEFVLDGTPGLVCLVPAGDFSTEKLAEGISSIACQPEGSAAVVACESVMLSVSALHKARSADAVVLCVREWRDSREQVEDSLDELKLAHANVVGIALV